MEKKVLSLALLLIFVFVFTVGAYAEAICPTCGGPASSHSCCDYLGHDFIHVKCIRAPFNTGHMHLADKIKCKSCGKVKRIAAPANCQAHKY